MQTLAGGLSVGVVGPGTIGSPRGDVILQLALDHDECDRQLPRLQSMHGFERGRYQLQWPVCMMKRGKAEIFRRTRRVRQ